MNAIHDETQLRTALTDAAESSGLSLDTDAILRQGHRKVRGRQLGIAAGAAAAAIAVALSFSLGGRPTAAPVPANPTDISSIAPGSFGGVIPKDESTDVNVQLTVRTHGSTATETWVINGTTVTREVPAPTPGWVTVLPDELNPSKKGVAFAVYTGPVKHPVGVRELWEPNAYATIGERIGTKTSGSSLAPMHDSTGQTVGEIAYSDSPRANELIGVAWQQSWVAEGESLRFTGDSMVLRPGRPADATPVGTVRVAPNRDLLIWRLGDSFGTGGSPLGGSANQPGDLKAATQLLDDQLGARDFVYGWVHGDAEVKVQSASSADGAFTVAYSEPKDGWRAFTAMAKASQIKGPVTVTAGQLSTTLSDWESNAAAGGQTAPPATQASTN